MTRRRDDETGMILVNVLLIVALAASVVMLMTTSQDIAITRSLRLREASQAAAIARGGELSAIASLRRAQQGDGRAEAAAIKAAAQQAVRIEGGSFALSISDAQSRYNLAALRDGNLTAQAVALRIGEAAGLDRATMLRLGRAMAAPDADPAALAKAGLNDRTIARLSRLVTTLPVPSKVNLNSAEEPLIAALTGNPVGARILIERRRRHGYLTADDLKAARLVLPPEATLGSDLYWMECTATVGQTGQRLVSLLYRRFRAGKPQVVAIARWWGAAGPILAPPS